jgi:hypothetical protein
LQETGLKEIELHDDDPDAMMALLRCIYDLPCDDPSKMEDGRTTLEFLAEICVVAEKYQVSVAQANIAKQMEDTLWWKTERDINMDSHVDPKPQPKADDLLTATRIIFNGTSQQDNVCLATLVKFCVLCIRDLNKIPGFVKLLGECGELGAAIITNKNLSVALEGSWCCDEIRYRRAIPRCGNCREIFSMSYIRKHRDEKEWTCEGFCGQTDAPMCLEYHDGYPEDITWEWEE